MTKHEVQYSPVRCLLRRHVSYVSFENGKPAPGLRASDVTEILPRERLAGRASNRQRSYAD